MTAMEFYFDLIDEYKQVFPEAFDKDGNLKDWIGYWRDQSSGQLKRKHKSGGRLFDWVPSDKRVSPLRPGDITHSGDQTKGSITENGESIDEFIKLFFAI